MVIIQGEAFPNLQNFCVEGEEFDFILADLPYELTANEWDKEIPLGQMWYYLNALIKPGRAICLHGAEPFASKLRLSNLSGFKHDWYWIKNRHGNPFGANQAPLKIVETISTFNVQKDFYYPQKWQGKPYTGFKSKNGKTSGESFNSPRSVHRANPTGERFPLNTLHFDIERGYHPTQKPVPLLEYLIKTYTLPGDRVLDFCMGSGSTAIACQNTGRKFVGIEKEQKYVDIALQRIKENEERIKNEELSK